MNGLVLSGGGGKGAYQIGVWKALRKLNYDIDIVTGTSVGALNALLITQNSYLLAPYIWKKLDFKQVFNDDVKGKQNLKETISMYSKHIIENNGIDTKNLEKKLDLFINYDKFYNSKINFGLVTYNLSDLKPESLTKKEIPKNKLKDYLVASSACFPAFKLKDIEGDKYIDGGYFDILPINLAIDMGASNIVAVDLKSIGIRRKVKDKSVHITYIYPKNYIGYTLIFDKDTNKRNIQYGYNDTMKAFKVLEGNKYTFKKDTINKIRSKYLGNIRDNLLHFLGIKQNTKNSKILSNKLFNDIITKDLVKYSGMLNIIEKLGQYFNVPPYNIYSVNSFNLRLHMELNKTTLVDKLSITNEKSETIKYIYNLMLNNNVKLLKKLALSFPSEFICAIYLYTTIKGAVQDV